MFFFKKKINLTPLIELHQKISTYSLFTLNHTFKSNLYILMEYHTPALIIELRSDDIIKIKANPNWTQPDTLEVAKNNVAAIKKAVDGKKRAILCYTPNTHISKEILKYYSDANPSIGSLATAMISSSFGSKLMGNLFLRLLKKGYPVKIFTVKEEDKAIQWLLEEIKKAKD